MVLLGRPQVAGTDVINTENEQSAYLLTRHLLDHGHRRVVYRRWSSSFRLNRPDPRLRSLRRSGEVPLAQLVTWS
ncbi:hypothetical protein ALI144C_08560 [Actinosynnema sp. ALI-1.44]|uniref:LacI family transcriptional regulator n=1 Tax=Actinosynnema sp. ALI-1.44 TaxID=1933779 RepID=UPI00097C2D49|nr:LacI family transcriptional regulator [Actinosynnema sp. ALI-1.44]ONI87440.1 hypothetical protein ALI144C_08560 [Actinosynnema sp. ALI-1.44]